MNTRTEERTGPRRRPATGGYARGEEKRSRIIQAAIHRFGEDGYEGASTRDIAQDAGVNPPALQYYFDSKEGLYAACFDHITEKFSTAMQDVYQRADAVQPGDAETALTVFCDLLDTMAEFLFETTDASGWRRFIARVKARDGNGSCEDMDNSVLEQELLGHCFRLIGIATGASPDSEVTRLQTLAAMGTLTAFHMERDNMLRRLNWPDLRGPRLVQLKALIRRQVKAALA